MAFVGSTAFREALLMVTRRELAIARISAAATAKAAFKAAGNTASGYTEELGELADVGGAVFDKELQDARSSLSSIDRWFTSQLPDHLARYLSTNASIDVPDLGLGTVMRATALAMLEDSPAESVDAAAPSVGSPAYDANNWGNGSASVAVNSDTTLTELLPDGEMILVCQSKTFEEQNAERWKLFFRNSFQADAKRKAVRQSLSRNFVTGTEYTDIVSIVPDIVDDPRLLVPQVGSAIHTGAVITVSAPNDYDDFTEGTDTDGVFAAYSVQKKSGTKSNLTRRNTTWAYDNSDGNGTIYLHVTKDGSNFYAVWRQGSSATSAALTEILTFTAATSGTQSWLAAATNPESTANGGFLRAGIDTFISCTVDGGNLATSNVVDVQFFLPWGFGDKITVAATNDNSATLQRAILETCGVVLPANAAGGETISDP